MRPASCKTFSLTEICVRGNPTIVTTSLLINCACVSLGMRRCLTHAQCFVVLVSVVARALLTIPCSAHARSIHRFLHSRFWNKPIMEFDIECFGS